MAKLILHIGTHKTATTTIQGTFATNHAIAFKHGLTYPILPSQHHGLVADWINLPAQYHYPAGAEANWRYINETHAGTDSTVLISTEELSRGTKDNQVNFTELREWTSGFDEVQVVCVLREQVSFIQSIFFEVFKKGGKIDWAAYLTGALNNKMATGLYLDYNDLYERLLADFDAGEVSFIPYRPAGQYANPLDTLLNHIGFPELIGAMKQKDANKSPSPLETWLAVMIARPGPFDPELANAIAPIFGGLKTTLFSVPEYKQVRERFAPLNEQFLDRYSGLTNKDLELAHFSHETHVFRNQITQKRWLQLAKLMRGVSM